MSTRPDCGSCRHGHELPSFEQLACEHPNVAVRSVVKPAVVIGVEHSAVRHSAALLGKPQCGPDGIWWEPKEAN